MSELIRLLNYIFDAGNFPGCVRLFAPLQMYLFSGNNCCVYRFKKASVHVMVPTVCSIIKDEKLESYLPFICLPAIFLNKCACTEMNGHEAEHEFCERTISHVANGLTLFLARKRILSE